MCRLPRSTTVIAYVLMAVSTGVHFGLWYMVRAIFGSAYDQYGFYNPPAYLIYFQATTNLLTVFGMVLAPYFGLASFVPGPSSVWVKVKNLINGHISFPFIGGAVLFYLGMAAGYSGFSVFDVPLLIGYLTFVILSSLIVMMAVRSDTAATPPTA